MHALLLVALVSLLALSGCAYVPMYGTQGIQSEAPGPGNNAKRVTASGENSARPKIALKKGPGFVDPKLQPYSVMGKTYWPVQSAMGFREEGFASWYGMDFHGKKTATGEIYDMFSVSAAHKTLPLGSKVRVHNMENGRTLDLVVNDRGPFVDGRVIDLSYASARLLGMADNGVARVRVEGLEENPALAEAYGAKGTQVAAAPPGKRATPTFTERTITEEAPKAQAAQGSKPRAERPAQLAESRPDSKHDTSPGAAKVNRLTQGSVRQPAAEAGGKYAVQVGAFSQEDNARRVREKLVQAGFGGAKVTRTERGGKVVSVVQAGRYAQRESAEEALRTLKQEFPTSFINTDA